MLASPANQEITETAMMNDYPTAPRNSSLQQTGEDGATTALTDEQAIMKSKNLRRRRQECTAILAIFVFCVALICKGVSYANSHWANSELVDVYKSLEKFPIMALFLSVPNNVGNPQSYLNECTDQKCIIFFSVYQNQKSINEMQRRLPPPLFGTYSRGINTRCETLETSLNGGDIAGSLSSKFEKCSIDKERHINEFESVRALMIVSMTADGLASVAWVGTFFQDAKHVAGRASLAVATLLGLLSSLVAPLSLGLFAQAIDIARDHSLALGWPFYIVVGSSAITLIIALLSYCTLYHHNKLDPTLPRRTRPKRPNLFMRLFKKPFQPVNPPSSMMMPPNPMMPPAGWRPQ